MSNRQYKCKHTVYGKRKYFGWGHQRNPSSSSGAILKSAKPVD